MDYDDLPANKLKIRDSKKKENNLVEIFSCIFGDQNFNLFKLALLKRQKSNLICKYIYATELYLSNEYLHRKTFRFRNSGVTAVVI